MPARAGIRLTSYPVPPAGAVVSPAARLFLDRVVQHHLHVLARHRRADLVSTTPAVQQSTLAKLLADLALGESTVAALLLVMGPVRRSREEDVELATGAAEVGRVGPPDAQRLEVVLHSLRDCAVGGIQRGGVVVVVVVVREEGGGGGVGPLSRS